MVNDIVLSICIPHYNGGERCLRNIKSILEYSNDDIEIVISDNCSTDNTVEELEKINDERLHIVRNAENVGPIQNGLNALKNGRGKYCMLLLDRDILQIKYLQEYIFFLQNSTYGVVLNMHSRYGKKGELSCKEGIYWALCSPHPSYYVFLNKAFQQIVLNDEMMRNAYYPGLIAMAIMQNYKIYRNINIPIVLEAEKEYIVMNSSRSWNAWKGRQEAYGFEVSEYLKRFEKFLMEYCKLADEIKEEEVFGICQAMESDIPKLYYYAVVMTHQKYRYEVIDQDYTLEEYKKLYKSTYAEAIKILKKNNCLSVKLLFELYIESVKCCKKFIDQVCEER